MEIGLTIPFLIQGLCMLADELHFHRRRGLTRWERIGHPLDTLTALACLGFILAVPFSLSALPIYVGLALFSILFVTKDEPIHAVSCTAGEHWLHAVLFSLHPMILASGAILWPAIHADASSALPKWILGLSHARNIALVQFCATGAFFLYQSLYWNVTWRTMKK